MNFSEAISTILNLLKSDHHLTRQSNRIFVFEERIVVVDFPLLSGGAAIDLEPAPDGVTISVVARDAGTSRLLRNSLLFEYPLGQTGGERHILDIAKVGEGLSKRVSQLIDRLSYIASDYIQAEPKYTRGLDSTLPVFWWDHISNFGDVLGPSLVSRILNTRPVNSRNYDRVGTTLFSVGSIVAMLNRDDAAIWGSGLLKPLTDSEIMKLRGLNEVEVLAVRGLYTELELKAKLGWTVPAIYGDPALLLPRYMNVSRSVSDRISVVLHWEHVKHAKLDDGYEAEDLCFVDVRDNHELVVEQIGSSRVCISSSLHGVIIAQAYGVPWVWLQLSDHQLHSSNFKFDDFFTTVDRPHVSKKVVKKHDLKDLNWHRMAEAASLPELRVDLDLLEAALTGWASTR